MCNIDLRKIHEEYTNMIAAKKNPRFCATCEGAVFCRKVKQNKAAFGEA